MVACDDEKAVWQGFCHSSHEAGEHFVLVADVCQNLCVDVFLGDFGVFFDESVDFIVAYAEFFYLDVVGWVI